MRSLMTPMDNSAFILLHPDDNILVCRRSVAEGSTVVLDDEQVILSTSIELGHKIARHDLKAGERVLRYGFPIGSMKTAACKGEHVHGHNLSSDYIPSHGRDAVHIDGNSQ